MKSKLLICSWALLLPLALVIGGCPSDSGSDCPVGQTKCGAVCVDTSGDRINCGACMNACLDGQYCAAGACVACSNECMMGETQCAPGTTNQYQACGDPDSDTCLEWAPATSCGAGEICVNGACETSCTDGCAREDAQACDTDGANGFRVCGDYDADDCLEWGTLTTCSAGEACVDGYCVESCVDECPTDGDRMCAALPDNGFLICGNFDGDSCREWGSLTLCPQGETCSAGACSADCSDECNAGERICDGNGYRVCGSYDADPCLEWSGVTDCAAFETCAAGNCEVSCTDECANGTKQCSGVGVDEGFDVCGNYDADPCLEWGNHTPCAAGDACINGNCVEDCQDECANNGLRICDGSGYRTCLANVDADSCLEWSAITDCSGNESCFDGVCSEVCIPECAQNDTECFGAGHRSCELHGQIADCWVWGSVTACGAFEICDPGTVSCVSSCSDECQAGGSRRCNGDLSGYQECAANWDADPCLEWGADVACQANYVCHAGTGQCELACSNECLPSGAVQCSPVDNGTETCEDHDADGCLEWGGLSLCTDPEVCSNGACDLNCTDECPTVGELICDGGVDGYRACTFNNATGCNELGSLVTCVHGADCQAGSGCVVVCTDDCAPGEMECQGFDVMSCAANWDADECYEWGVSTSCNPASQLCYNNLCVANVAPTTVLINEFLYNPVGTDSDPDNWLFIELYGVANQDLANYSIVGVNGNSGVAEPEYVVIPLDGYTIPADGHFVIVHPNGHASLQAEADLVTSGVDLQNGPDNVHVRWAGSVVVDAVGYETFAAGDNWAGEGADYTDDAGNADSVGDVSYCLSRSVNHRDDDVNRTDFYRRSLNNCSPGWEGPGAILGQSLVYGGTSTPALDAYGNIWTVDRDGWLNVTYPDWAHSDFFMDYLSFNSSVAVEYASDPPQLYIGGDDGVRGYEVVVGDPASVTPNFGPVGVGPVFSTPAVSLMDGAVFFGTQGSGVYGFNADGTQRFNYATGGAWVDSSPSLVFNANGDEVLVFGVGGVGSGMVVAVCAYGTGTSGDPCENAGDELWAAGDPMGGCNSSPAVAGGLVYIGCDDGGLYAYDLETGLAAPGFPIDIGSTGTPTEFVEGCSPVTMPDGLGNTLVSMTSRSDAGDLYLLSYDGTTVTGASGAMGLLMSSAAFGADGSSTFHMGEFLVNYAMDGTLQWDAYVTDSGAPSDAWIHSSPTWAPSNTPGIGLIFVVDPAGSELWVILATSDPATATDSFPQFHGDWFNSGSGW